MAVIFSQPQCVNPLCTELFWKNTQKHLHQDSAGSCNPSSQKTRTHFIPPSQYHSGWWPGEARSYSGFPVHLELQGARASAAYISQNIPASAAKRDNFVNYISTFLEGALWNTLTNHELKKDVPYFTLMGDMSYCENFWVNLPCHWASTLW